MKYKNKKNEKKERSHFKTQHPTNTKQRCLKDDKSIESCSKKNEPATFVSHDSRLSVGSKGMKRVPLEFSIAFADIAAGMISVRKGCM